jgi:ubiquinone/menaquinone biosynthesis C-methylase UbiE
MSRQGERQARTADNIKEFWNREAQEWGKSPQVTIRDHYFRLLEIRTICGLVRGRKRVLDIGCGTGFSTLFYAQEVEDIIGADYAANMISWARRFLDDPTFFATSMQQYAPDGAPVLRGNVRFEQGNILDLQYPASTFDCVIAERVLINLHQRLLHEQAIAQVARVLQPGGVWALVEVTQQGHSRVDALRAAFGLPIIEKYWHNLYVDEPHLQSTAPAHGFRLRQIIRFETFQFLTKVVHPLVVAPEEPKFLAPFNLAALRVSEQFPTYERVRAAGVESFFRQTVRTQLAALDPEKLPAYDRVCDRVLAAAPDFTGCSHQVLFVLDKPST